MNLTIMNSTERDFHVTKEDLFVIGSNIIKSKERETYLWTNNSGARVFEAKDSLANCFVVWCKFGFFVRIEGRRFVEIEFALDYNDKANITIVPTEDGVNIIPG